MRANSVTRFIGQTFHRLMVVGITYRQYPTGRIAYAMCRCQCGTEKAISLSALRGGDIKSCGCKERERISVARSQPPKKRQRKREWVWTIEKAEYKRRWAMENKELRKQIWNRSIKKYPNRRRARYLLQQAVKSGLMPRLPCEQCGAAETHGHHDDYSQPLNVRWLCLRCHAAHHRQMKKAAVTSVA
jgi:hypothetical protein